MNAGHLPTPADGFTKSDTDQLDLLGILAFVYAGLQTFMGLFWVAYAGFFGYMFNSMSSGRGAPPPQVGIVLIVLFGGLALLMWTLAGCLIASGVFLRRRQRHTFSFVVACVICLFMPLGTALGVFTLIVLSRASVKRGYQLLQERPPAAGSPYPAQL